MKSLRNCFCALCKTHVWQRHEVLRSNYFMGMTGFDSVNLRSFAAVRECSGSRYPQLQRISANTDKLATFKKAFANFRMPEFAPSLVLAA